MSTHLCCTILVWASLQLIYFIPLLMKCERPEQFQNHKKCYYKIQIYLPQNKIYQTHDSLDDIEWKICDLKRQRFTKMELLLRNIVSAVGLEAKDTSLERKPSLSKEEFQNVSSREKSMSKFKTPFSFKNIRKCTVGLTDKTSLCILEITHISKYSSSKIRNSNSRYLVIMQPLCIGDTNYTGNLELKHDKLMSNNQDNVNFCLWTSKCNLTTNHFEVFVSNFISKGLRKLNVQVFYYIGYGKSLLPATTVSSSHISSCNNCSSQHAKNNSKQTSNEAHDNVLSKKTNSRKNRFLLTVNSNSHSDEEKRGISDGTQKARYAGNKKARSTSNQRDSPNESRYASKVKRRWKRRSHRRLAKDSTFAAAAKRAKSSRQADATAAAAAKRAARISFSPDNEADYRREIDRQIEADFAKIKDSLRLEEGDAISRDEMQPAGWPLNAAKSNLRSVSQPKPAIDNQESEIITAQRVCVAPRCQQVIRRGLQATKSRDSNELAANSRVNVAGDERNGIAVAVPAPPDEKMQRNADDARKLVGEALIILNKNASPLSIVEKSNGRDVNLKYSVESISLGLDELLKMGREVMKTELANAGQNETKGAEGSTEGAAGLSYKVYLKYANGNNETYRGLEDDDEGTKLEEQLKELRNMNMQRGRGFTNRAKNEMRFAAGDEYTFRKDEAAKLSNEYSSSSSGHVKRKRKRCSRRNHKSPSASNISHNNSQLMQNGVSHRKKIKYHSQKFNDDVPSSYKSVRAKKSSRVKKNDPYKEYAESKIEENWLPGIKVAEHSRNKRRASQETPSPSNYKEAAKRKRQTLENLQAINNERSKKGFIKSKTPHKEVDARSRKKMCASQPSSTKKPQSQMKKRKKAQAQPFSSRRLKSIATDGILCKAIPARISDILSRDIDNICYYDYDDVVMPAVSLDHPVANRNTKTNGPRRKLLSSNSMEYDEGSPISADEESNYDYAEKFYGDQPDEREPLRLHYFQINLRNVTPPANARKGRRGSRIELAQCHVNKSMKTISKIGYSRRTLKSVGQEENSDHSVKKDSLKNLYLTGDLIGYDYDPQESEGKEKFKRAIDENEDPDLARLFADGQEYDINVRGKLHLRLKDPESNVAGEKSSKRKRSAEPKIEKSRKKHALAERKFAVPDKRTKGNRDEEREEDSIDVHKEHGNLESKVSNKTRKPLKKTGDVFKRKSSAAGKKKEFGKKFHARAKVVRVEPEQDYSQSTFPPSDQLATSTLESRRGDCKCACETTTTTLASADTFEPTDVARPTEPRENNDFHREVQSMPDICRCREKNSEMSSVITRATPQYATNRPATDRTTVTSSDRENSEGGPEQKVKMNNVLEILNFIKKLEKLLKGQKSPFRIEDEHGGVEIKLEKIYLRPGKNQSIAELKDVSEKDQKEDISNEGDTSEVIRQSANYNAEGVISSSRNQNARSSGRENDKNTFDDELDQSSKLLSNANDEDEMNENNADEASQTIKKPKKYKDAILETYIEASLPKSSPVRKNAGNNKSLPAKQWIDEQRIAANDQSSLRGGGSTSSGRKRKTRRRKKRRRRLRKRTVNGTGVASKKGKAPYRLRRRRRRRLSSTIGP